MAADSTVFLMYHELSQPGRATCRDDSGYRLYVVEETAFRAQMDWLCEHGFRGLSVGSTLDGTIARPPAVTLTFDDGCETDLTVAAPHLLERDFGATFYVVAEFVGRRGFLSAGQVRELAGLGFEIGCHSMTHAYLDDLNDQELRREVVEARDRVEQLTGRRVAHFSCPGGRWTPGVARLAREAGLDSVTTSRTGAFTAASDRFRLPRVAVRRHLRLASFGQVCRGRELWLRRMKEVALGAAKNALGNGIYERLRQTILKPGR